jgi:L-rhamnose mutarotase
LVILEIEEMRRFGQYAMLKPECVEEYKSLHAAVWPNVLATITKCNIQNYSIHIRGTDLFAYFEYVGSNYEADMACMEADPITQKWWKHTKPCFARHDEKIYYSEMEEIFHQD